MSSFKYYNPQKYADIPNTCILRALSLIKMDDCDTEYAKYNWRNILLDAGFEYVNIPAKPFQKRMTVSELAQSNSPNDIIICSAADHVVCIIGNDYFDVCDTGNRCVFYYFRKEAA